jgi:uncharacterized protein
MPSESILNSESEVVQVGPSLLTPINSNERIASIDVLRGVALLGILSINIWAFALPYIVFNDPRAAGGWSPINKGVWIFFHLLCEQKMMSLFSMLFGAGLVVMVQRSDARGTSLVGIYYRRICWLLVFGLLHVFLLWEGDILVPYALCGFLLYPFRRLGPRLQIFLGTLVFLSQVLFTTGLGLLVVHLQEMTSPNNDGGTEQQRQWRRMLEEEIFPSRDTAEQIERHHEGYADQFGQRADDVLSAEIPEFLFWSGPRAGGLMLIGMGLMQLRIFSAQRSFRFYARLAVLGYLLGLPLVGYGILDMIHHDFEDLRQLLWSGHFNYLGSLFVALGHVGLVMLICKAALLERLMARLAAVGRMALSNYLMQSLQCTTLFEGWGLGLFGELDRIQLVGVVVAIWSFQLAVSPLWLRSFRFGPMEWLWRSLTYWKWHPLRADRSEIRPTVN